MVIGTCAHVDAGKTTLTEALLYNGGMIPRPGRVDDQNTVLDNSDIERERGITVYNKEAYIDCGGTRLYIVDTPGHIDFAPEAERALSVLDAAIMLISSTEGVKAHTKRLWTLLRRHNVPTIVFVNKMDMDGADHDGVAHILADELSDCIVDLSEFVWSKPIPAANNTPAGNRTAPDSANDEIYENIASCDEKLMDHYLEDESLSDEMIIDAIFDQKIFPCFYGSALRNEGIDELLNGLLMLSAEKICSSHTDANKSAACLREVTGTGIGSINGSQTDGIAGNTSIANTKADAASRTDVRLQFKVYRVSHDQKGVRCAHIKVCAGTLKAKELISTDEWSDKINEIRIYSGSKYETVGEAPAGSICRVTGLNSVLAGDTVTICDNAAVSATSNRPSAGNAAVSANSNKPSAGSADICGSAAHTTTSANAGTVVTHSSLLSTPVMAYRVVTQEDKVDTNTVLTRLKTLEDEMPELHVSINGNPGIIHVMLMGEIQAEVVKRVYSEKYPDAIDFADGCVAYRETITDTVEGVGHYEPLKHYAEVHLVMSPLTAGTGLIFETKLSEDVLDRNWQRLILTHLGEKVHTGVLTNSPLTDIRFTLVAGRSHLKHTEGGDFRQATYRAIRHGLMQASSQLLEPYYSYELVVPQDCVGRAMSDMDKMFGTCEIAVNTPGASTLTGTVPVSEMNGYERTLASYTKGEGQMALEVCGYRPCHNSEAVIESIGYRPEADTENPASSVFCAHGAGFAVNWDEVVNYMHLPMTI